MPAVSEKQRRLFAAALSIKKGKSFGKLGSPSSRIARTLSLPKIKEFTHKVK